MYVRIVGSLVIATVASACTDYDQPPVQYVTQNTVAVQANQYYVQPPAAVAGQDTSGQAPMAAGDPQQQPDLGDVPDVPTAPGERVDEYTITSALDGYGAWDTDPTYGNVWTPSADVVGADFAPYGSNGDWVSTDQGWYWQSGYTWGWLPFHYGRWIRRQGMWGWLPGRLFAPAWVDWRMNESYVGWAPLPAEGMAIDAPYAFCAPGYLGARGVWSHVVYGPAAASIYANTRGVPATYGFGGARYSRGPEGSGVPVAAAVPIANAWHGEVGARAGARIVSPVTSVGRATPGMAAPVAMSRPYGSAPVAVTSLGSRQEPMRAGVTSWQGTPRYAAPAAAVTRSAATYGQPVTRSAASYSQPATVYRAASTYYSSAPAYRPAYAAPAASQAYHPAYSAPSYSAPAYRPTYSAPAYHSTNSAPSYHYSAPAYHSSGGGYHGGGRR